MNNYEKRVNLKLMTAKMYSIKISLKLQQQTEQCPKKRTNNRHHFFFLILFFIQQFLSRKLSLVAAIALELRRKAFHKQLFQKPLLSTIINKKTVNRKFDKNQA